jgi:hypothetical protein
MKLKLFYPMIIVALIVSNTGFSNSLPSTNNNAASSPKEEARVEELKERLDEIASMDLKKMPRTQKRELKKEVRSIKKEMKAMAAGGVYISVGALIIIILLLILL